ncbi:MAG: aminotransferase class I/II-fold pyridoxal phosphate-dependent enzyme [Muribaculaceae bacterium]|nr:aminotransferase class I/II-fold pyridoxal phosphate-dependent enzyme [Muribaculaceae bacterium]
MSGKELDYVIKAFEGNWIVPLGPDVDAFEVSLEKFVNKVSTDSQLNTNKSKLTPHPVVALSSGTAALHLALACCDVKPGDEVLVQSFTFCASSNPVTYLGATPVFIDSEPDTWNMDPGLLEFAIKDRIEKTGKKPKAIIPVALYGMPYQIDKIMEIANRHDIPVIEDAAEGFGSRFKGKVLGTFGRFGVLSFNGNKMITTSGGGALICDDEEAKKEVMFYATQARESYPYYQHERIGYNYRMSNICAAIGRGQMTILEDHIAHHKHVQEKYIELLKDVEGITIHQAPNGNYDSNYWLCTAILDPDLKIKGQENAYKESVKGAVGGAAGVTHKSESIHTDHEPNPNVEALRIALDKANIESRPLWKPMHRQPVYRNNPAYINGVSDSLFKVGICLPSGPYVTDSHLDYIVSTIKRNISY